MLVRPHLSIASTRRGPVTRPDAALLADIVAPKVLDAMRLASQALASAGVRHVVVGGLAVGANGYPRATRDVDFLVGREAFEHHAGGLVTLRPGVPFQVNGIAVDFLSPDADEAFLEPALSSAPGAFADAPVLVYLKLKSPRSKDRTDIIELLKAGIDRGAVRAYLAAHAPAFVAPFEAAIVQADAEAE